MGMRLQIYNSANPINASRYGNIVPALNPMESFTVENVKRKQRQFKQPWEAVQDADRINMVKKRTRILASATEIKLSIAVETHCVERELRTFAATVDIDSQRLW